MRDEDKNLIMMLLCPVMLLVAIYTSVKIMDWHRASAVEDVVLDHEDPKVIAFKEHLVKRSMVVTMYGVDNVDEAKAGTTVFTFNDRDVLRFNKDGYIEFIDGPCPGICITSEAWQEFFTALHRWNREQRDKAGL